MSLQLLGLRSFKAAGVMLFGLLAYDVFWVFGSPKVIGDNVMLAVATSDALTGPTRLLFPRFSGSIGEASRFPFSLLGQRAGWHPPFCPFEVIAMCGTATGPHTSSPISDMAAGSHTPASTWRGCLTWPGLCTVKDVAVICDGVCRPR